MQEQEGADAHGQQHGQSCQTANDTGWNSAEFVATMPSRELMAKKLDAFVLTDLLKAEVGGEPILQELQRRLLQADKKATPRQEYCCRTLPIALLGKRENLSDLLLGELIHPVKDEQRRGWLRRFRYCCRAATGR
jgi:hypothetical protein